MSDLLIRGGSPISGTIKPSGNKNAVLPMLCATLLTDQEITLTNVPEISDMEKFRTFFERMGSEIRWDRDTQTAVIRHTDVPQTTELPTGIRSSVMLIAPMVQRVGNIVFDTSSKGCELGLREIDPHLKIIEQFGCKLTGSHPYVIDAPDQLIGTDIWADYASVTATETFIMMAVLAKGTSVLNNAACEPHVQEFCLFLNRMGAQIEGIGTSKLLITGVESLTRCSYRVPDDHHEVATYLAIAGVSGGRLTVETDCIEHVPLILRQLEKLGMEFTITESSITVESWSREVQKPLTAEMVPKIEAAPWPYFPADLLPQFIAVASGCNGQVMFWNKIYEGALAWVGDLASFGVKAHLSDPHRAIIFGDADNLRPASVSAPYIIRVVVAYFILACQIPGESKIKNADPLRRAHPHFVEKLTALGADVEWVD